MKHTDIILFVATVVAAPYATAQSPNTNHCPPAPHTYQRLLFMPNNPTAADQLAQREVAQEKEHQFWIKTERFIASWSALVREYNENGTFNMKKAKEVAKAFHDLEKSEGWPK